MLRSLPPQSLVVRKSSFLRSDTDTVSREVPSLPLSRLLSEDPVLKSAEVGRDTLRHHVYAGDTHQPATESAYVVLISRHHEGLSVIAS